LVAGATVLVRDKFSAESINALLGAPVADYCPDLAFLYPTASAEAARPLLERTLKDPAKPIVGLIPNQRCVEAGVTPLQRPEHYIDCLARSRDFALSRGFNVVGLSHMLNTDRDVALIRDLGVECITTNDTTLIRSIIANLAVCVCSRYHGVVSCLSHGTPVLALGWHHKYRNLMNDMELGAHHVSVAELPRDPAPLLDRLYGNRRAVRETMARNVAAARRLVSAKTAALKVS
jgi:polysaccharide pyruvyl transferase WcaK-like protein